MPRVISVPRGPPQEVSSTTPSGLGLRRTLHRSAFAPGLRRAKEWSNPASKDSEESLYSRLAARIGAPRRSWFPAMNSGSSPRRARTEAYRASDLQRSLVEGDLFSSIRRSKVPRRPLLEASGSRETRPRSLWYPERHQSRLAGCNVTLRTHRYGTLLLITPKGVQFSRTKLRAQEVLQRGILPERSSDQRPSLLLTRSHSKLPWKLSIDQVPIHVHPEGRTRSEQDLARTLGVASCLAQDVCVSEESRLNWAAVRYSKDAEPKLRATSGIQRFLQRGVTRIGRPHLRRSRLRTLEQCRSTEPTTRSVIDSWMFRQQGASVFSSEEGRHRPLSRTPTWETIDRYSPRSIPKNRSRRRDRKMYLSRTHLPRLPATRQHPKARFVAVCLSVKARIRLLSEPHSRGVSFPYDV